MFALSMSGCHVLNDDRNIFVDAGSEDAVIRGVTIIQRGQVLGVYLAPGQISRLIAYPSKRNPTPVSVGYYGVVDCSCAQAAVRASSAMGCHC